MASVELKNVSKVFRPKKTEEIYAVANLDLTVADRELLVLVGPSGSGKTTTLRLIAGLEKASAGTISIDGIVMNDVRPQDRDITMVFQRDALYPHMTVFENMAFGLRLRRVEQAEIETRVKSTASVLGLTSLLDRRPRELSGGQRQRTALGRALVRNPKVFLLDEPLANLDAPLRAQMRAEISRVHARLGTTMIYVTHDQAEAGAFGARVVVMHEGTIQQIGDPSTLYHQPANMFVAGFIGSPPMNLFRGRVVRSGKDFVFQENNPAGTAQGSRLELPLPRERGARVSTLADGYIVLGLRCEHIVVDPGLSSQPLTTFLIERVQSLGWETHLHFHTGGHHFAARMGTVHSLHRGDRVPLLFEMARAVFFHPVSGKPIV